MTSTLEQFGQFHFLDESSVIHDTTDKQHISLNLYCSSWILCGEKFRKNRKIKSRRSTSGLRLIGLPIWQVCHLLEPSIRYVAEPFMLSVAPSQALKSTKRLDLLK